MTSEARRRQAATSNGALVFESVPRLKALRRPFHTDELPTEGPFASSARSRAAAKENFRAAGENLRAVVTGADVADDKRFKIPDGPDTAEACLVTDARPYWNDVLKKMIQSNGGSFVRTRNLLAIVFVGLEEAISTARALVLVRTDHIAPMRVALHVAEIKGRGEVGYSIPKVAHCRHVMTSAQPGEIILTKPAKRALVDTPNGAMVRPLGRRRVRVFAGRDELFALSRRFDQNFAPPPPAGLKRRPLSSLYASYTRQFYRRQQRLIRGLNRCVSHSELQKVCDRILISIYRVEGMAAWRIVLVQLLQRVFVQLELLLAVVAPLIFLSAIDAPGPSLVRGLLLAVGSFLIAAVLFSLAGYFSERDRSLVFSWAVIGAVLVPVVSGAVAVPFAGRSTDAFAIRAGLVGPLAYYGVLVVGAYIAFALRETLRRRLQRRWPEEMITVLFSELLIDLNDDDGDPWSIENRVETARLLEDIAQSIERYLPNTLAGSAQAQNLWLRDKVRSIGSGIRERSQDALLPARQNAKARMISYVHDALVMAIRSEWSSFEEPKKEPAQVHRLAERLRVTAKQLTTAALPLVALVALDFSGVNIGSSTNDPLYTLAGAWLVIGVLDWLNPSTTRRLLADVPKVLGGARSAPGR